MVDVRHARQAYGLGPPIDGTQQRLDVLIALHEEVLAALRAKADTTAAEEPSDGETVELRGVDAPEKPAQPARKRR